MVALTLLRRAGPARLVAGMRVSSASSSFARPMVSRMSSGAMSMNVRAFSGSATRFGSGTTDISVSKMLEELKYEQDSVTERGSAKPEFLTNFLDRGIWSIDDVIGIDKVTISRKFGDENIRITFSTDDIVTGLWFWHDDATEDDDDILPHPVLAALSITKSTSPGTLNMTLLCNKGKISIERLLFDDDTELDPELTAEERNLYTGHEKLDAGLKKKLRKYLQERGIDRSMVLFIPEYAAHKEQQEQVKWLNKFKNFVDL